MEQRKYYDPEIETMGRKKLEELQLERLKWRVLRCYENSILYRQRFDKAGVKPGDINSLDDIRKIPPVTKNELRDKQFQHPPFGRHLVAPAHRIKEVHPSSGTTGTPVNNL